MRFKGTLVLLIVCALLGGYVYFYEIKGGQKRDKAKEAEKQVWKFDGQTVQQIDLISPARQITGVRQNDGTWKLTSPEALDADSDEMNTLANSASNIQRESVVEPVATDLAKFGLSPARSTLKVKTRSGTEYAIEFGNNNPTGNSTYAVLPGKKEIFLVASAAAGAFDKKLNDLRNHKILVFEQPEVQNLSIKSPKGALNLEKDGNDRWWIVGKEKIAADSPGIRGILNALSMGRINGFLDGSPEDYRNLGMDNPLVDVRIVYGKSRAMKHLVIGAEKTGLRKKGEKEPAQKDESSSGLYLAKDESRPDFFFVNKDLIDKLEKAPNDLRDKALASFQRWDVDYIALTNPKGTCAFNKSGGEWFVSGSKKKAKWDGINAILDAMEKPVKEWIDKPGAPSTYGLDKPPIHVVLKQGGNILADCSFGKPAKDGIYAQVKGDSSVKVADPDGLDALNRGESDLMESQPAPAPSAKK
jgi:hypothetical protein